MTVLVPLLYRNSKTGLVFRLQCIFISTLGRSYFLNMRYCMCFRLLFQSKFFKDCKLTCWRQCGKAVFQTECKCVVYFPTVNWKDGPSAQPSLQAESVRQLYEELGCGQLYCVGQELPKYCGGKTAMQVSLWRRLKAQLLPMSS